jgi:hypothetical protein
MNLNCIPNLKQTIMGGIMAIDFEVDADAIAACVGFRQNSDAQV